MSTKKYRDRFRRNEKIILWVYYIYLLIELANMLIQILYDFGGITYKETHTIFHWFGDGYTKVPFLIVGPIFACMISKKYHFEF